MRKRKSEIWRERGINKRKREHHDPDDKANSMSQSPSSEHLQMQLGQSSQTGKAQLALRSKSTAAIYRCISARVRRGAVGRVKVEHKEAIFCALEI